MGYLANIIKDSHLNPAGGSRLGLPLPDLDRQPWPDVTQTGEHIPGRPPRRLAGQNPPAAADVVEPDRQAAETDAPPRRQARRLPRVKKHRDARTPHPAPGYEPTDPGGMIEALDADLTLPVIQRNSSTAAAWHPARAGSPTVNGFRQPDLPSRSRPAPGRPAALDPAGASAGPAAQGLSPRVGLPVTRRRDAAPPQNTRPMPPETAAVTEDAPASAGRLKLTAESAIPVGARLKATPAKPALPVSSTGSVPSLKSVSTASAGRRDEPRVQIGQVNVIVEESRVSPKAPPGDRRRDDSASRTFLRSL
jgi:hypothetical protein